MNEDLKSLRILIVDDTLKNIQVLGALLKKEGYQIVVAQNGLQALDTVQKTLPDLILLDIMMPELDGFEVCKRLKQSEEYKDIPVIFLTAKVETEDILKGFQLGAVDYITKPIQVPEVLARVNTHLTLRNLQKELESTNEMLEQRVAERTAELAEANQKMQEEIVERKEAQAILQRLNSTYERFVPHQYVKLLDKNSILDVNLGEHIEMPITILFCDIRSFTKLSETMSPRDNFKFMNSYLDKMGPLVSEHHGFIDKYIGDSIMALFDRTPSNAIQAGIAMLLQLNDYNIHRKEEGYALLDIGLGINYGMSMLGIIGEQNRMDGTVISDAVNLASRLEGLTKLYGTPILISERVYKHLENPSQFVIRFVDRVKVKGKTEAVSVYEICDADSDEIKDKKLANLQPFEEAWQLYQQKSFEQAIVLFQECSQNNPSDQMFQVYLERCQNFLKVGTPEDWDGTIHLDDK